MRASLRAHILYMLTLLLFIVAFCGCSGNKAEPGIWREDTDPGLQFTNEAGQLLYIGMSQADCEAVLGLRLKQGWKNVLEGGDVSVSLEGGSVRTLSFCNGCNWVSGSGLSCTAVEADIQNILGEPAERHGLWDGTDVENTKDPVYGEISVLRYVTGDSGMSYFMCAENGDILRYTVYVTDYTDSLDSGYRHILIGGTGSLPDGGVEVTHTGAYPSMGILEINYYGEGPFSVAVPSKGESMVLVETQGPYSGRFPAIVLDSLSFDVEAQGEWDIAMYNYLPLVYTGKSISGDGDYTTQFVDAGGSWNVNYTGEGHFALKIFSTFGQSTPGDWEEIVFVEAEGPYSGTVQWPEGILGAHPLVITADGPWSLEKID